MSLELTRAARRLWGITPPEWLTVVQAANGLTAAEDAASRHLAEQTIRSHRKRALRKMNAASMNQACALMAWHQLLPGEPTNAARRTMLRDAQSVVTRL